MSDRELEYILNDEKVDEKIQEVVKECEDMLVNTFVRGIVYGLELRQ